MKKLALAAAALLATTAIPAQAVIIKYTISGTFSGFTDGGPFSNQFATFTGYGDTSTATTGMFGIPSYIAVQLSTFTAFQPSISTTYQITTPGTFGIYKGSDFDPTDPTARLGFIFNGDGNNGIALKSTAFNGYSGLTGFAQTAGTVYFQTATFQTNLGEINIRGFTDATFSASVPEPAGWALMLAGFGAVGFASRRRAKVRTTVTYA